MVKRKLFFVAFFLTFFFNSLQATKLDSFSFQKETKRTGNLLQIGTKEKGTPGDSPSNCFVDEDSNKGLLAYFFIAIRNNNVVLLKQLLEKYRTKCNAQIINEAFSQALAQDIFNVNIVLSFFCYQKVRCLLSQQSLKNLINVLNKHLSQEGVLFF